MAKLEVQRFSKDIDTNDGTMQMQDAQGQRGMQTSPLVVGKGGETAGKNK